MTEARVRNRLHAIEGLPGIELLAADFSGEPFGRHSHDAFALGAIHAGVGGYHCRGARHALARQTLSLMNPDEPHNGYALSERLRYTMLYISETALGEQLGHRGVTGFRALNACDPGGQIERGLTRLLTRVCHAGHSGWQLAFQAELIDVLSQAFVVHGGARLPSSMRDVTTAQRVRAHLQDEARRLVDGEPVTVSLSGLAERFDMHPNALLRTFRREYGLTPYAYWLQRRIEHARSLLGGRASAADVAVRLGFHDQPHFIRTFRHVLGVTPGHYIRH
ncbi:helix-turn-helix transcriptional regulator [Larsenimonas suaedae]|uniref:AraC family transcriptional regulator n=1 Tax=Larsenimonas suaedae TaxID=1851019 RepID=A0ABU1GSV7_9GAMM|nr:AraC family transcriptional regulator [Larsenimonas suaedae]MCM2972622.1 AraC family transcriptional regulator [Larsenimonas suaedae]MDR5894582.1 AraC family transcriptional regulator [Larsenimonas suaedae]